MDLLEDIKIFMKKFFKTTLVIILIILAIVLFNNSYKIVNVGEVGIKVRLGAVVGDNLKEGLCFKIPFIEDIKMMDCKMQKEQVQADSASKDLQDTKSEIAVNFRVDLSKAGALYKNIGITYAKILVDPSIQESVKATTAMYTAEELITKRAEVSEVMRKTLQEKLEKHGLLVDNVNIINFRFSDEFTKAIESKQVSAQLILKARNDLETTKVQAEQKITQAQAEATSQQLLKQQITPELIQWKTLDKWNGVLPVYTGGQIPLINIK